MKFNNSILNVKDNLNFDFKNSISIITKKKKGIQSEELLNEILFDNNIKENCIATCIQKHSSNVKYISKPRKYNNLDGLVTHIDNNIVLIIQTADCIPIFLFDKKQKIIGLVHSGWKGTSQSIIKNAINIFIKNKSNPSDILVYLGPSIKSMSYEIKDDVATFFSKLYLNKIGGKLYLSIQDKVIDDLLSMNVKKKNIINSDVCTYDNLGYCSYRRDGKNAGRMYSIFGVFN
tara:strand:- start:37 stop:732 length:696 start_codon:yes stop_codon:yes gene_type:complete